MCEYFNGRQFQQVDHANKGYGQDLEAADLREHYWDQIHPRTGRFRPKLYQKSTPWHVSTEIFVGKLGESEQNFRDWFGGTYQADVQISDGSPESEVTVRLTLSLDFTKNWDDCIHWTMDTRASRIRKLA